MKNKEKLERFISEQGYDSALWFIEFVNETSQQLRIRDIEDKKNYLAGKGHIVTKRPLEYFAGKPVDPRKVVLQYARSLIEYAVSYLLGNGITYSGDEQIVRELNKLNKRLFDGIDYDIVENVYSYGNAWELLYNSNDIVKSSLIDPLDAYPIIDNQGEYIAFVECYTVNGVTQWNVFVDREVHKYSDAGGEVHLLGTYRNIGGLPINYRNSNPLDTVFGMSDLDNYISILDNIEEVFSKSLDGYYRLMHGILVQKGNLITNYDVPQHGTGYGIILETDGELEIVKSAFDHQAFETLYNYLMMSLMDISSSPAVAMGKVDISNLSEISLKLTFTNTNLRSKHRERFIKEGLYQRLDKLRVLLEAQGKYYSNEAWDSINITFNYAMPTSQTDIINNLKTLREMDAVSRETMMKYAEYITDIGSELQTLQREKNEQDATDTPQR